MKVTNCSICGKEISKKEMSESFTVPICKECVKDLLQYGTD